jgi:hypothetical protein
MTHELERIWKDKVQVLFETPAQYLPGESEETFEGPKPGRQAFRMQAAVMKNEFGMVRPQFVGPSFAVGGTCQTRNGHSRSGPGTSRLLFTRQRKCHLWCPGPWHSAVWLGRCDCFAGTYVSFIKAECFSLKTGNQIKDYTVVMKQKTTIWKGSGCRNYADNIWNCLFLKKTYMLKA